MASIGTPDHERLINVTQPASATLIPIMIPDHKVSHNSATARSPLSPCTGVCSMAPDGFCRGCWRSMDEIARWSQLDHGTRLHIISEVLPLRRQERIE